MEKCKNCNHDAHCPEVCSMEECTCKKCNCSVCTKE